MLGNCGVAFIFHFHSRIMHVMNTIHVITNNPKTVCVYNCVLKLTHQSDVAS